MKHNLFSRISAALIAAAMLAMPLAGCGTVGKFTNKPSPEPTIIPMEQFDKERVAAALLTTDYSFDNCPTYTVSNYSPFDLWIDVSINVSDRNGKVISAAELTSPQHFALPSGKTTCISGKVSLSTVREAYEDQYGEIGIENVDDYDAYCENLTYENLFEVTEAQLDQSYVSYDFDCSFSTSNVADEYDFVDVPVGYYWLGLYLTNNNSNTVYQPSVHALFFKDGQCVGYDYDDPGLFEDDWVKPGEAAYYIMQCERDDFDDVKIFFDNSDNFK